MLKKLGASLVLTAILLLALPPSVTAQDDFKKCWGVVTSQRARSEEGIADHSSNQTDRIGLGNVVRLFGLDHIGLLGQLLAMLDDIEETEC